MNGESGTETKEEGFFLSHWGAPLTYDGSWEPHFFFFITAVGDMTPEMWSQMGAGRQMDWVIVPIRSQREFDSGDNQDR